MAATQPRWCCLQGCSFHPSFTSNSSWVWADTRRASSARLLSCHRMHLHGTWHTACPSRSNAGGPAACCCCFRDTFHCSCRPSFTSAIHQHLAVSATSRTLSWQVSCLVRNRLLERTSSTLASVVSRPAEHAKQSRHIRASVCVWFCSTLHIVCQLVPPLLLL